MISWKSSNKTQEVLFIQMEGSVTCYLKFESGTLRVQSYIRSYLLTYRRIPKKLTGIRGYSESVTNRKERNGIKPFSGHSFNRKDDSIKKLKVVLILLILMLVTGCMGNDKHETHVSRGETDYWHATIQTTFSNESGKEQVHTEGGLEFKQDYSPKEVEYKITYPSGESSGSMRRGKKINIQSTGGSRSNFVENNIEKFAEEMTLHVTWENEVGEVFEETIPLE